MKKTPIFAILTSLSATIPLGCVDSSSNNAQFIDESTQFVAAPSPTPAQTTPATVEATTPAETSLVNAEKKTPGVATAALAPLPKFDALIASGAKIDKSGKSLDLTGVEFFTGLDVSADAERWNAVKVVRGKGVLPSQALRAFAKLPNLTEFLWSDAVLSAATDLDAALAEFAKAPNLKKLRLTGLRNGEKFPTAALVALAQAPQLADLDVSGSPATAADLTAVDWKNGFAKLTKLNLYQTQVGDAGVDALLPLTDRLTSLNLDDAQIGPESAKKIAQFTELTFLHVGRSTLDDASIAEFAKLGKLEKIHVTRSKATEAGADALRAALPNCEVVSQPEN